MLSSIKDRILQNRRASNVKQIAKDAISENKIGELLDCICNSNVELARLSVWPINHVININSNILFPYLPLLINEFKRNHHPSVYRTILRIFIKTNIPPELESTLVDYSFKFLYNVEMPIAVRAFSMHILLKVGKKYPEILNETAQYVQLRMEFELPAFKSVGRKVIAANDKINT